MKVKISFIWLLFLSCIFQIITQAPIPASPQKQFYSSQNLNNQSTIDVNNNADNINSQAKQNTKKKLYFKPDIYQNKYGGNGLPRDDYSIASLIEGQKDVADETGMYYNTKQTTQNNQINNKQSSNTSQNNTNNLQPIPQPTPPIPQPHSLLTKPIQLNLSLVQNLSTNKLVINNIFQEQNPKDDEYILTERTWMKISSSIGMDPKGEELIVTAEEIRDALRYFKISKN